MNNLLFISCLKIRSFAQSLNICLLSSDQLILKHFETFVDLKDGYDVTERWHGVYPKSSKQLHVLLEPASHVQIVNGLGGAGMTLSFGLAEEVVSAW